ncbi:hypothetical protein [Motiliproteus sp. SC1-56]|uniref:hypothetical protein n=1 Tax=Motiliproteus sp. SC1-56 TaxID=2799565 RepID=UPI001A8E309A|nr:hypothetical protein [Motiliproteus sp. SC1-56]
MKIQLTNLPREIDAAAIAELFPDPALIRITRFDRDGDPDSVTVWVEVETSRLHAQLLAQKIAAIPRFERRIGAYVPLFG